jgi:hypothetical protein
MKLKQILHISREQSRRLLIGVPPPYSSWSLRVLVRHSSQNFLCALSLLSVLALTQQNNIGDDDEKNIHAE